MRRRRFGVYAKPGGQRVIAGSCWVIAGNSGLLPGLIDTLFPYLCDIIAPRVSCITGACDNERHTEKNI